MTERKTENRRRTHMAVLANLGTVIEQRAASSLHPSGHSDVKGRVSVLLIRRVSDSEPSYIHDRLPLVSYIPVTCTSFQRRLRRGKPQWAHVRSLLPGAEQFSRSDKREAHATALSTRCTDYQYYNSHLIQNVH
jgi:hypothetical protein